MVSADDHQKVLEAHHEQRVRGMSRARGEIGLDAQEIQASLSGSRPSPHVVPNRLGTPDSEDYAFARKQVDRDLKLGTLMKWPL
jgi:hypothetical protein